MTPNPTVDPLEARLGLSWYLTDSPGCGGRLRTLPEDFVVEEVPLVLPRSPVGEGKYTVARVRARNWETNRLMQELQRRLGLGRHDIFFAGTKDKRAVTTQYVSLRAPEDAVRALAIRDVDILDTFRTARAPKIGELAGNRFEIVVRDLAVPVEEATASAAAAVARLQDAGGFPDYFGLQRFGVVRPVTHVVGERILRGDLAAAV
ncbi:MAG TPA: tRNA pseudouridine(13) synthase TruD, partial [Candidatus Thermoplasmatota archaeon]|nr:tRNA pseudouridine(13) synthase TruD [Candidatus Thermoplasmatota archaeon]